jgi:hypothetical protein
LLFPFPDYFRFFNISTLHFTILLIHQKMEDPAGISSAAGIFTGCSPDLQFMFPAFQGMPDNAFHAPDLRSAIKEISAVIDGRLLKKQVDCSL